MRARDGDKRAIYLLVTSDYCWQYCDTKKLTEGSSSCQVGTHTVFTAACMHFNSVYYRICLFAFSLRLRFDNTKPVLSVSQPYCVGDI
jgi:hypothetical protein